MGEKSAVAEAEIGEHLLGRRDLLAGGGDVESPVAVQVAEGDRTNGREGGDDRSAPAPFPRITETLAEPKLANARSMNPSLL